MAGPFITSSGPLGFIDLAQYQAQFGGEPVPPEAQKGETWDGGGWWPNPKPYGRDFEWERWTGLPGLTVVTESYSRAAHVVDDFGQLVEVCGLWGS